MTISVWMLIGLFSGIAAAKIACRITRNAQLRLPLEGGLGSLGAAIAVYESSALSADPIDNLRILALLVPALLFVGLLLLYRFFEHRMLSPAKATRRRTIPEWLIHLFPALRPASLPDPLRSEVN